MAKQFLVIGLGRFGCSVARTLVQMGADVLAVDINEEAVDNIAGEVTQTMIADTTDEKVLNQIGVKNFDVAIVAIGQDIQSSVMTSLLLKEKGVPLVIAKANDALHGKVLEKIGVDKIVYPERDIGVRVAQSCVTPGLLEIIPVSLGYSMFEFPVPSHFFDKTLRELNLRKRFGINVISIRREREVIISPGPEDKILENDVLIVIGDRKKIKELKLEG